MRMRRRDSRGQGNNLTSLLHRLLLMLLESAAASAATTSASPARRHAARKEAEQVSIARCRRAYGLLLLRRLLHGRLLLLLRLLVLGHPCLHPSCHVNSSTSYDTSNMF